MKQLETVRDALSTKENLIKLREKVDQTCGNLTLRANIVRFQEQKQSVVQNSIVTDVYRIELTDIQPYKKGYLLLKYSKKKNPKLQQDSNYLIDKIKLVINKKGEIVLISTSLTVMIEYKLFRPEDEESYDVDSLGLSQEDDEEYYYADG